MKKIKKLEVYEDLLIVVDMVNGFVREGVLHDEAIARIIPRQIELIRENKERGGLTIFIKDTHDENATEFIRFGNTKHCLVGTREAELVDELKTFAEDDDTISVVKNSTSFMEAPAFRELAQNLTNVRNIDVVGCCTDICVANGTMAYANYLNEHNIPATITVHEDAIATYAEDERKEYVDAAKILMKQQGIQLVKK